eukprot:scaffold1149_cov236-Pinguiococcus_pyrenoidosus.AAC.3
MGPDWILQQLRGEQQLRRRPTTARSSRRKPPGREPVIPFLFRSIDGVGRSSVGHSGEVSMEVPRQSCSASSSKVSSLCKRKIHWGHTRLNAQTVLALRCGHITLLLDHHLFSGQNHLLPSGGQQLVLDKVNVDPRIYRKIHVGPTSPTEDVLEVQQRPVKHHDGTCGKPIHQAKRESDDETDFAPRERTSHATWKVALFAPEPKGTDAPSHLAELLDQLFLRAHAYLSDAGVLPRLGLEAEMLPNQLPQRAHLYSLPQRQNRHDGHLLRSQVRAFHASVWMAAAVPSEGDALYHAHRHRIVRRRQRRLVDRVVHGEDDGGQAVLLLGRRLGPNAVDLPQVRRDLTHPQRPLDGVKAVEAQLGCHAQSALGARPPAYFLEIGPHARQVRVLGRLHHQHSRHDVSGRHDHLAELERPLAPGLLELHVLKGEARLLLHQVDQSERSAPRRRLCLASEHIRKLADLQRADGRFQDVLPVALLFGLRLVPLGLRLVPLSLLPQRSRDRGVQQINQLAGVVAD